MAAEQNKFVMADTAAPIPPALVGVTTEYPCCYLPNSVNVSPTEREMFLEIGPGHLPCLARTWMSKAQIVALPAGVTAGTKALKICIGGMAYNPTTAKIEASEITTAAVFYLVAVLPMSGLDVAAGTAADNPMYECLWASHQRIWQLWKNVDGDYNVLSSDKTAYATGTAKTGTTVPYSVQEILDYIEPVDLGLVPATMVPPNNFVARETPVSALLARLFRPYAWQLQFNPWAGTYSIKELSHSDATEPLLLADYSSVQYEGDSPDSEDMALGQRTPASLSVAFPDYPKTVPGSGGTRYTYHTIANPSAIGPTGSEETLIVGDRFSVTPAPTYTQNLTTIAAERAASYFKRANIVPRTCIFNGHYSTMLPGTQIRRVRIGADIDGTHTTVQIHGMYDCPREDHHTKFEIHGLVKTPHWPEHNEALNDTVNQRDDGTVEIDSTPQIMRSCIMSRVASTPAVEPLVGTYFATNYVHNAAPVWTHPYDTTFSQTFNVSPSGTVAVTLPQEGTAFMWYCTNTTALLKHGGLSYPSACYVITDHEPNYPAPAANQIHAIGPVAIGSPPDPTGNWDRATGCDEQTFTLAWATHQWIT